MPDQNPPCSSTPRSARLTACGSPGRSSRLGACWFALALLAPGCASYRPTESGYLGDYSGLQKDSVHINRGLGLQRNNSHDASPEEACRIDSFYVEPSRWLVDKSSRGGGDPKRQAMLTAALQEQLREQLGALKPIVDQPGPNTAMVRSAITRVKLSRPLLNAALLTTAITPVFIGPMFNGGGSVEAEVIGPDGRQVSAISCASGGGILDVYGYFTKSSHAKKAMKRSVRELVQTLEP